MALSPKSKTHRSLVGHGLILASLALVAVAFGANRAVAQEQADAFVRPAYQPNQRFNEDWSALRGHDPATTGDLFDPIKFVPLNADGSVWASFGGQLRSRFEHWGNFGYADKNDDDLVFWRARMHGDFHVGEHVRFFIEGKSALLTPDRDLPGTRRTLDVDEIDLQQAFADLKLPLDENTTLTIRGGRQELLFGAQRLVSPLDWSNTRRTWDGVSAILDIGEWRVTGFWAQFAPVRKYEFNQADRQTEFYGVYAAGEILTTDIGLDLYFLVLNRVDPVMFNGTTGDEDRFTLGGRAHGKVGDSGFDYDLEGAYQFGEIGAGDINAFMVAGQLGYKFADAYGAPRVWFGVDYASGDEAPGGDVETFNQLFPLGHKYFGFIDTVARQNVIDINPGLTIKPFANVAALDKLSLLVWGHVFLRAQDTDALYNAGGAVVRGGGLSNEREIGAEIDVLLKYPVDRHLTALLGYSHFFAGDFIEEATPAADKDIDFFYLSLEYTF